MKKQREVRPRIGVVPFSNNKPLHGPTRKRLGELAELAFMCKAASLGFGVAKPYGDSDRFDFIVSWDGRLCRVQVKSTRTAYRGAYEIGAHGCWGGSDVYTKDEIDLIAAYVVPEDTWYVIPIEATRGRKRLCLHPNVPRRACYKYEKYREAWWLMKSNHKPDVAKSPR
ncbi:MAG TPA: group I intron-associated PD-(D/E)XK endonuclease [Terriglobales bacterium]|nr:group I intron-associated PD-(D/E)XK endonuclease [Terriglobales bacterium]